MCSPQELVHQLAAKFSATVMNNQIEDEIISRSRHSSFTYKRTVSSTFEFTSWVRFLMASCSYRNDLHNALYQMKSPVQ